MAKAEGIIIRTTDYGENNKIVTLYTETFGKIGLMARGAKKPKNPLSAVCQVLFYGLCLFQKGRGLGTLYQAESLNPFKRIRTDVEKAGYASLVAELTDRLTEERQSSPGLYRSLCRTLILMEKGTDAAVLASIYAVKMMRAAGIDPELDRCISCGRSSRSYLFSFSGGGFLCPSCAARDPYALPLSAAATQLLPLFKRVPMDRIGRISLKSETIKEIETIIRTYYEQNAGLKLRSQRFIDQLSRFRKD
ncbi:DNA repair protein RecO [Sporolactobacillus sp. THM7-7]|nr:DNA repair protein RecO [Sporolactobacillus sp. THM7-7]